MCPARIEHPRLRCPSADGGGANLWHDHAKLVVCRALRARLIVLAGTIDVLFPIQPHLLVIITGMHNLPVEIDGTLLIPAFLLSLGGESASLKVLAKRFEAG